MTGLKTGDIYLVRFHPGYGAELKKFRPAVIMSSRISTLDPRFALIAPLTTDVQSQNLFEIPIAKGRTLESDSLLLCWYLWTIDHRRLEKKLGTISSQELKLLHQTLTRLLKEPD